MVLIKGKRAGEPAAGTRRVGTAGQAINARGERDVLSQPAKVTAKVTAKVKHKVLMRERGFLLPRWGGGGHSFNKVI